MEEPGSGDTGFYTHINYMSFFRTLKQKLIYTPLLFYPLVRGYSWFLFGREFSVSMPTKEMTRGSTHFVFVLTSKKDGGRYIVKHRNICGDIYFLRRTGVKRLPWHEYRKLLEEVTSKEYTRSFVPEVLFQRGHILWEYLETARPVDDPHLGLSLEKRREIWETLQSGLDQLKADGIIYGKLKTKHILYDQSQDGRVILIDWDTARYAPESP